MLKASCAGSLTGTVSEMRKHYKPVIGAIGAFLVAELVRRRFGMGALLIVLAVMLLAWGLVYIWAERALNQLYAQFQALDDNGKDQALGQLDPEIRKGIEKRIAKAKIASEVAAPAGATNQEKSRIGGAVYPGRQSLRSLPRATLLPPLGGAEQP